MKKILVLAPHADDEVLGCGGTINKISSSGSDVFTIILTNAYFGAPEIFSKNLVSRIRKEAISANKILKVKKLFFEDFPAPSLDQFPLYKIADKISEYINRIKPDTVFIPSDKDSHIDHKIIYSAAMVALRPTQNHIVNNVLAYETLSETHWGDQTNNLFSPNYFEKLTKRNIKIKNQSFSKYKSQKKKFPHPRSKNGIETLSNFRGMQIGTEYAEAFEVKRYTN